MNIPRRALYAFVGFSLACNSVHPLPRAELSSLRDRAHFSPVDSPLRRDAALAELVAPGGDPSAAEQVIADLSRASPDQPRVQFAQGLMASQHGEFERAVTHYSAAIDAARVSTDPLGWAVAEASAPKLVALRGDVRDFDTPFRALVDRVVQHPGHLGPTAREAIVETAVRWARERGDRDAESRWTIAAGCVTTWTVVGPFGPLPMLRFDETLPPQGAGPLGAAYDLGPGRGITPTYTVRARGCAANLGHGVTLTGVLFAATDVSVEHPTEALLHVESPNVFTVYMDGATLATVDPRRSATGSVVNLSVHLAAGTHTLRVKIASRYHSPLLVATLTDRTGQPIAHFSPPTAGAHPDPVEARPESDPLATAVNDAVHADALGPNDPFARYVASELAFARRNVVAARELLRPMALGTHPTALTLIAWASIALGEPFLPGNLGRSRARQALEDAAQGDIRAYYPALELARLAAEDDRADDALMAVRAAARSFPDNPEIEVELAERLMSRNWDGEARAVLEHARNSLPSVCWPVRLLTALAQRHADGSTEWSDADAERHCDALTDDAAGVLTRLQRWRDAEAEYRRLLDDDPEGHGLRRALVEIARSRGRLDDAIERARGLLPELPEDDGLRADLADMTTANGHPSDAVAALDAELARAPAELAPLYRIREALTGHNDLDPWRLDGLQILRDFIASGHTYTAAAVLILDYTVRRILPDGSALELTHNIVKVQSQEGVDAFGEFTPPQGATVLRVRTLKSDGRVLEPESIAGKESLSLPDLRPGDALEFEYVRSIAPSDVAPGGFLADRFYFRGFDIPYDHSEYVVVVPRAMSVLIDPRGALPTLQRDDHGALVEYRWVARQSNRMSPEPRSVAAREFIPSVALGFGATWDRFVDALRDRLADLDPVDPEALRLVSEITHGASTPTARLAALHHWVVDHVQQEGGGTPFESAPRMLSARQGHRTRVLCYLLNLANVPCTIALVRQGSGDATPSELADDETFQSLMLRVDTEMGERWVTAADHNAPVNYVPPGIAGEDALVLTAGRPHARLPALDLAAHARILTVHLALRPDGSGRVTVEERLRGFPATGAREVLRRMDPANRDRQFEAYVGGMVAGASLESVTFNGVQDPEADMVFRYTFTAPGLASVSNARLTFDGIFPAEAAQNYAESPTRTVPQWNADPVHATLDLTVALPTRASLDELPAPAAGHAPGIDWSIHCDRTANGFHVLRQVDVPTGRVTVANYPTFASAVRALDAADTRRIQATLPGPTVNGM